MLSKGWAALAAVALALAIPAPTSAQGDAIYKSISNEQLETLLKSLGTEAKKTSVKGATHFDFERKRFKIRLYNYGGKDLMLDAVFSRAPWEIVNDWNRRAKFSRAVLIKDGDREACVLESNLDCVGGVTLGAVKQFLLNFDDELRSFDAHLTAEVGRDEKIVPLVTNEILEKILADLKIDFQKNALKNQQGFVYDFKREGFAIRLSNYNGTDLMIDSHFKKATLEKVNKWNNKRKFIRAVSYQVGDREYTSLESNLDCVAGVSELMIRHFIVAFDSEAKDFAKFLDKE